MSDVSRPVNGTPPFLQQALALNLSLSPPSSPLPFSLSLSPPLLPGLSELTECSIFLYCSHTSRADVTSACMTLIHLPSFMLLSFV